jgi:hypothetical protein
MPDRSTTRYLYISTHPIPTQYAAVRRDGNTITTTLDFSPTGLAPHRTQATEEILATVGALLNNYIGEETDTEQLVRQQTTAPKEC